MSTQTTFPRISYTQRAENALTLQDRALLGEYFTEVKTHWQAMQPKVTKVVVDLFIDLEEDIRRVVVNHYVDTGADEALQYWDVVSQKLDDPASGVSAAKAVEVLSLVSTNVIWRQ